MLTEPEVQAVAQRILREKLGPFGFSEARVNAGLDHDGEPALFVDAIFQPNAPNIGGRASSEALVALRNALLEKDEERFPYLLLRYPDDEFPESAPRMPGTKFS
ncbi:MAG TPA: hypothetical protein VKV77_07700 [Methylovirgula sp.]|nr:hypothetical protein [Methylovirgula sp.]